jgi:SulP family sulfate permease
VIYSIQGPLFFGAAQRAMHALAEVGRDVRGVVLDLRNVPVLDATGLSNLESTLKRLRARHVVVALSGLQTGPARILERAGLSTHEGQPITFSTLEEAVRLVHARVPPRRPSNVPPSMRSVR